MSYITNDDIELRLGAGTYVQLADDDGDGVADAGVVDEARLGAEGEVNGYLARRYQVPIDTGANPELVAVLKTVVLDLVELRLRARRPPVPEEAAARYLHAVVWLQRVASGEIDLPSAAALPPSTLRGALAQTGGEERVLSHEELASF